MHFGHEDKDPKRLEQVQTSLVFISSSVKPKKAELTFTLWHMEMHMNNDGLKAEAVFHLEKLWQHISLFISHEFTSVF